MGWIEYQVGSNFTTKQFVERELQFTRNPKFEVVKISEGKAEKIGRGRFQKAFYVAFKEIESGEVHARVYLTQRKNGQILIKSMKETEGPCYYEAPASFIGLLSPTDNEIATQWRADVLATETLKTLKTANKVLVGMFGEENN